MSWNLFATGAAVIAGALGLGVAELAAGGSFLVAAKTGSGVIVVLQAIEAAGLSVIGTAIASTIGELTEGLITAIATREDSNEQQQPASRILPMWMISSVRCKRVGGQRVW